MSRVRVCFLGTPEFAQTCLASMLEDEHFEIVGVVTQPDRPRGRKLQLQPCPVKSLALAKGIEVLSPDSVNQSLLLERLSLWGAEVAVVVAFGQILSDDFLKLFPLGAVNVHASLLPRWRGAAPIQRAIEVGDEVTGVCLQKVVKKLDAGDLLGARQVAIEPNMNSQELHDLLAEKACELLHVELMDYVRGNLAPVPQNPEGVCLARKIDKAESELNWQLSAQVLHNRVRAFVWGPGTWTWCAGKKLKIIKTKIFTGSLFGKHLPGELLLLDPTTCLVCCGEASYLELVQVQPESRKEMSVTDWLSGNQELKQQQIILGTPP